MAEGEDRTQAASERRLARARAEGQAPLSRELVTAAGMAAFSLVMLMAGPGIAAGLAVALRDMLLDLDAGPAASLYKAGWALLGASMPLLGAVALAGGAAVLLQTGFLVHGEALMPDPGRLSPRRGIGRILGVGNAVEALKSVLKLAVLAWVLGRAIFDVLPQAGDSLGWTPGRLIDRLGRDMLLLVLMTLAVQSVIAVLDVGWMRWRFAQRMRMGREELRQEQRESEGDPRIKARLRQLRLARARRRMLAAVSRATVVVTNPTHFAIALAYERGTQAAPRVVAKGVDEVAARIREAAERAGVPLVANPPLARSLYGVPLDAEVPAEHFRTVAEIIAYVWRLKGAAGR